MSAYQHLSAFSTQTCLVWHQTCSDKLGVAPGCWSFLKIMLFLPWLFSACRTYLSSSSFFSVLSLSFRFIFSQLPTISLSNKTERVNFKPVIGMLFILHSLLAACSFFWSSEPQAEQEPPWHSQYHCLCFLVKGKRRHMPPSTPLTIALPLLTLPLPPTATSVGAGKA